MRFLFLVLALPAFACFGCGSSSDSGENIIVKGKLTDNGKPFALDPSKLSLPKGASAAPPGAESSVVRIVFLPANGKDQYPATFNAETGTFEVLGPNKQGIKPGSYKVAITANISPVAKGDQGDYFGGKFSPSHTPIVREVKPGQEIDIDLSKPKG